MFVIEGLQFEVFILDTVVTLCLSLQLQSTCYCYMKRLCETYGLWYCRKFKFVFVIEGLQLEVLVLDTIQVKHSALYPFVTIIKCLFLLFEKILKNLWASATLEICFVTSLLLQYMDSRSFLYKIFIPISKINRTIENEWN